MRLHRAETGSLGLVMQASGLETDLIPVCGNFGSGGTQGSVFSDSISAIQLARRALWAKQLRLSGVG